MTAAACPCPCHKPGHSMKHAQPCCGDAGVTHSPAPWEANEGVLNGDHILIRASDYAIAKVYNQEMGMVLVNRANARLIAAAPELLEALSRIVHDVDDLMNSSEGVAGLHLNGDLAPWSDLGEGGHFEPWIGEALATARAALSKATSEGASA